jgi:peptidoglycan lytic transglycosylase
MRMRLPSTIRLSLALLVASTPAIAKETSADQHHPAPNLKAKHTKTEASATKSTTKASAKRQRAGGRATVRSERRNSTSSREQSAELPPPDRYIAPVRVVGRREVGSAAWYGGRHIGHRTANGERLDAIHMTAAHRSLPLNSLVRVTNLNNGRSVIATINDRGPFNRSFVIDVSPRAAQQLDMVHSGVATVSVEPVVQGPEPPHPTSQ